MNSIWKWFLLCTILLLLSSTPSLAEKPDAKGVAFFESSIRPVLVQKCYQCHSAESKEKVKFKGALRVDTKAGLLKGGENGAAVVPGKPDESMLISALKHDSFKMPPKMKLGNEVVNDFIKWIEMGAPDPREGEEVSASTSQIDIVSGKKHWSFQPLKHHRPPTVKDKSGIRTPIDLFIRFRQEQAGITPNTIADPHTLIRRVSFDLIGLPPTSEEVDAFLKEAETDLDSAYQRLVKRLLQSEHYGERWGRHWLDLVRFAESNGYAFDKDRPNAFHYRDFVIRALNEDLPYDEFVKLQIAGDILGPQDYRSLSATGFLVAGTVYHSTNSQRTGTKSLRAIGRHCPYHGNFVVGADFGLLPLS